MFKEGMIISISMFAASIISFLPQHMNNACLAICLRLFIIIQYRYYLMHKLFVLSHLRTLQRLRVTEFSPANFEEIKTRNNLAPSTQALLYRLPREELKHIMNTQCPVNSLEQANAEAIIQSSKALRHHTKMEESRICSKCPFVKECKHASKPWQGQKYENTILDLLNYFHGLHQFLKPENIYYRQWVSAYRLGDSIIASIDDLSKGGKEIEEYDDIRLDGKKHFQERLAQKKNNEKYDENQDKQFQRVMSKVQTISTEKRKTEKPKEEPKPKVAESFGRDFSFDQELEFEPAKKFNKKSVEAEQTKIMPIQNQKGYQKIENEERPARTKPSYSKQRSQQDQDEGEFKRYQPKQGYQGKKDYEDRGYKKEWNGAQRNDSRYQNDSNNRYGNNKPEYQGNRYNGEQQNNRYSRPDYQNNKYSNNSYEQKGKYNGEQQGRYGGEQQGNRYNDRRGAEQYQNYSNKFTPKPRYDDEEGYPKINQLGKRTPNQFSKPRDNFNQEQQPTKSAPKANPFVSKWKESSEQEPRESFPSKPRRNQASSSEPQPKIVSVESANEESAESKRGRLVRRRRRSSEDEE